MNAYQSNDRGMSGDIFNKYPCEEHYETILLPKDNFIVTNNSNINTNTNTNTNTHNYTNSNSHSNSNNNKNNNNNDNDNNSYMSITTIKTEDETLLAEQSRLLTSEVATTTLGTAAAAAAALPLPYMNIITNISKSETLQQDNINSYLGTSLTDSNCSDSSEIGDTENKAMDSTCRELSPLLVHVPAMNDEHNGTLTPSSLSSNTKRSKHTFANAKRKAIFNCPFISRNWYLNYLIPISILIALLIVAYLTRDYAKHLLFWIEKQHSWLIILLLLSLFITVSFPLIIGYFVLLIATGYLFGFLVGFPTAVICANIGITIAHMTIRSFKHCIPLHRIIKNETGRAILRVISGPKAFKVVLFTRLTPIPFGIQNALFGISSISLRNYHLGSFLGLLPAQAINVYLGSTLRSMHEVLNNNNTAWTGYISFGVEVICGVALMFWVVKRARKELTETLISDMNSDGKLTDIEV